MLLDIIIANIAIAIGKCVECARDIRGCKGNGVIELNVFIKSRSDIYFCACCI